MIDWINLIRFTAATYGILIFAISAVNAFVRWKTITVTAELHVLWFSITCGETRNSSSQRKSRSRTIQIRPRICTSSRKQARTPIPADNKTSSFNQWIYLARSFFFQAVWAAVPGIRHRAGGDSIQSGLHCLKVLLAALPQLTDTDVRRIPHFPVQSIGVCIYGNVRRELHWHWRASITISGGLH